jgi:U3 small nucleolar RNA-associated protein 21
MSTTYLTMPSPPSTTKVTAGATVTVHATGSVYSATTGKGEAPTMKQFWSTRDEGQKPFTYPAGVGKVIKGWDKGCLGMGLGETRKLLIPSAEGYGAKGFKAWGIPPGATLHFEIEVLKIK